VRAATLDGIYVPLFCSALTVFTTTYLQRVNREQTHVALRDEYRRTQTHVAFRDEYGKDAVSSWSCDQFELSGDPISHHSSSSTLVLSILNPLAI